MACPVCDSNRNETLKTIAAKAPVRRRVCIDCGARWTSDEVARPASIWKPGDPLPVGTAPPTGMPKKRQTPPTRTPANGRGVGGGLSSAPVLSLVPNPDVVVTPDQTRARVRGPVSYTEDFEAVWRCTGKRGHKEPAFRAWVKRGKPVPGAVSKAWDAYCASLEDWRSPKDLSSWLSVGGHLQEWTRQAQVVNGAPSLPTKIDYTP